MTIDQAAPVLEPEEQDQSPAASWLSRLELLATLVMAVAAILTAWSAFQSTKWSGLQSISFAEASAARVESTRASTLAGQQTTIDVIVFTQWLEALNSDVLDDPAARAQLEAQGYQPEPGLVSTFLYERMRDEFRPALEAWLAQRPASNPDAARTPFELEEYQLAATRQAEDRIAVAEQRAGDARAYNQRSDNYVMTTVAFTLVLFFAGITTKLQKERNRILAFTMAIVVLVGAALVLATLPIEV